MPEIIFRGANKVVFCGRSAWLLPWPIFVMLNLSCALKTVEVQSKINFCSELLQYTSLSNVILYKLHWQQHWIRFHQFVWNQFQMGSFSNIILWNTGTGFWIRLQTGRLVIEKTGCPTRQAPSNFLGIKVYRRPPIFKNYLKPVSVFAKLSQPCCYRRPLDSIWPTVASCRDACPMTLMLN